jgi:hypothetical protein
MRPEVAALEQVAKQLARIVGDEHGVGLSHGLQSCSEVWRLAYHSAFLRRAIADEVPDDDDAGCNADPDREVEAAGFEPADGFDQR